MSGRATHKYGQENRLMTAIPSRGDKALWQCAPVRVAVAIVVAQHKLLAGLGVLHQLERLIDALQQVVGEVGHQIQQSGEVGLGLRRRHAAHEVQRRGQLRFFGHAGVVAEMACGDRREEACLPGLGSDGAVAEWSCIEHVHFSSANPIQTRHVICFVARAVFVVAQDASMALSIV